MTRCDHVFILDRWYWVRGGVFRFEPWKSIEAKYICRRCGKVKYVHPPMESQEELYFIKNKKDKQVII